MAASSASASAAAGISAWTISAAVARATSSTLFAALSRISPIRFSDSRRLHPDLGIGLGHQPGQLLVDLRLGLGGDLVRLVARLGERGVVGGLRLLRPPLQERRLLDVVRDGVVALGHHRADARQRDLAQDQVEREERDHQPEDQVGEDRRVELRHAGFGMLEVRLAGGLGVASACSPSSGVTSACPVSACAITITAFSVAISHSVLGGPRRPAAAIPGPIRPRTSAGAQPGTRRCRAPRRRRCR